MMTRGARHVFLAWTAASTKGAAASGRGSRLSDWFGISWPPYKGATEISDLETRPRRGIAKLESYRRAPSPRLAGVRKSPCRPGDIAAKYVRSLQACDPPTPPPPSETLSRRCTIPTDYTQPSTTSSLRSSKPSQNQGLPRSSPCKPSTNTVPNNLVSAMGVTPATPPSAKYVCVSPIPLRPSARAPRLHRRSNSFC